MFESLQQLAKMDGAEGLAPEDKGQLNYHVILIGESFPFLELPDIKTDATSFVSQRTCISSSPRCPNRTQRLSRPFSLVLRESTGRTWTPTFAWSFGNLWRG